MRRAALLGGLLLLALSGSGPSAPYASLRRLEDATDVRFTWEIGGAYIPHGCQGAGFDERGRYYTFTQFTGERQLDVAATCQWSCVRLGLSGSQTAATRRELRTYATGEEETTVSSSGCSYAMFFEYRVAPTRRIDPRIRMTHTASGSSALSLSVNYVFDPVVLAGAIGLRKETSDADKWLDVMLSCGLVANSRVSLAVLGQWSLPVSGAAIPVSVVGVRARASLDVEGRRVLRFRVMLTTRGQTTRIGFGCSLWGAMQ